MINYEEINDFIIKVFNYFNGRINVVNKAVLDINWANLIMCRDGGYSRLPNIVVINPMVINRYYGDDSGFKVKACIIETIIHELYHTDQLINYALYMSDINYNKFIEHACEVQTAIYMAGHIQEICNVFGINGGMSFVYDKCMAYWDLPGVHYQRRYYYDHLFMCIDDMYGMDKSTAQAIYEIIKDNVENKRDIIISINNERFNFCLNGALSDINQFNNFISKYVCTGLHTASFNISYYKDSKKLIIDLNTEVLNLMCKKV